MEKKLYIFVLLLLVSSVGFAQVEFTAKVNKEKIGLNERLRVDFEMNKNGDDFTPPNFAGFKIFAGPRQSISKSWLNGKGRFSKVYSFYLEPMERGTFTIGQATVNIDGEIYKTTPIEVEVTAAVDDPKGGDDEEIIDISKDVHIVAEVSNTRPYLGESIAIVYKLYVSQNASISNWRAIDIPKFANFWSHDMRINDYKVQYGSYQGQEDYRYVVIKKTILYPQKSGELIIEPLTMSFSVDVPTNRRDPFGRPLYKTVEKKLASSSRSIDVKPLPEEGRPAGFSGAVGSFTFEAIPSKTELEANESLDITLKASGRGNLKLFQLPALDPPNNFDVYDPEYVDNSTTDANGMRGNVSNIYTIVPQVPGNYVLDPVSFSFFDPKDGRYKTLKTKPIEVLVKADPSHALAGASGGDSVGNGNALYKRQVASAGRQFQYIKLRTRLKPKDKTLFFKSTLFWSLLFMPVVLLPLVIGIGKKQLEKAQDVHGKRIKKADKLTRQYLSEAKNTMGDQKTYYEALERALYNYLKAKLGLSLSEMSKDRVKEILIENAVEEDTAGQFIDLLKSCEFARYAPSSEVGMQQDYDKASTIISEVDKQLKA